MEKYISATVRLLISDDKPKKCVCCPDFEGHVFGICLDLEHYDRDYPKHFPRDADNWVRSMFDLKNMNGQKIHLTASTVPSSPSVSQGWLPITNVDPNAHLAGCFCRYMVHITLCSGKYGRELDIDIQGNIAGASVIEYAMEMITNECDEDGYMILTDAEGNTLGIEGDDIGEYVTQAIITSVESFPSYKAMNAAPQVKGVSDE